ncbi:MFS transporter [Bradyrhizobium sp. Arg68]|uniref:MFS transporter n=1 Tax=Bradyrhizobium ivorense TaxID=2511166 RepID=UPI001E5F945E|nr:MFS transporter [Bradyrhizobium ivorense]MCC8938294.1 MFS transporter [Bradyrhizobium ivorense]
MSSESQIPIAAKLASRRFAARLAAFYATLFGMTGVHLPFFTVWLKAIGIDATWIGIITAVPPVTRFTVLPLVTASAERRQMLRGAIIATSFATAFGFCLIGTQHQPLLVLVFYALTCCVWTPMVPLTDAYALRGVRQYGLNYGPLRLWGSAAFAVCALASGALLGYVAAVHLIWIITFMTVVGALVALTLRPLERPPAASAAAAGARKLLRDRGFLAIIFAAALIQSSHSAYYIFASIAWQQAGFSGLTIAGLWVLGVIAEIVLFALSPRFTLRPQTLVVIAAVSAAARWAITAQDPPLPILAVVQLAHALSFGLTQVGIMGLMVHHVPSHIMARGQGYLTACGGIVASTTSILCGMVYARYGLGAYYMMAAMAGTGGLVMWLSRRRFIAFSGEVGTGSR